MNQHEYDSRYTDYQTNRSALRKLVRKLYLRKARSHLRGKTVDIGCGVGELLATLPEGSKGLEYNRDTVDYCQSKGMDVEWYDGYADNWQLSPIAGNSSFQSAIISHVLEHFDEPMTILERILEGCQSKGIERVLVIVPGRAGYGSDPTHVTFVDRPMLETRVNAIPGWRVEAAEFFPGNFRSIGDRFTHHELQFLISRDWK